MGPKCIGQGQHNVTCLREKETKQILEYSYEVESSSAPDLFPSIPMPPFPSFVEPFKPTFETGIGSDPNLDTIVKGNAFDLLQYQYQSNHNVLFELTGFEGNKYFQQFHEIVPMSDLDLSQFQDLLRFHFRTTCYRTPVKERSVISFTFIYYFTVKYESILKKSDMLNNSSRVIECEMLINDITNAYKCENAQDKPSNQNCDEAIKQFFNDLLFTCNQGR